MNETGQTQQKGNLNAPLEIHPKTGVSVLREVRATG